MSPCLQLNVGKCIFSTILQTEVQWIITVNFLLIQRKLISSIFMSLFLFFFPPNGVNINKKMHVLWVRQLKMFKVLLENIWLNYVKYTTLSKWAVVEKELQNSEHNNTVDRCGIFLLACSFVFWKLL